MRTRTLLLLLPGLLAATVAWSAPRIPAVDAPAVVREGARYETVIPALPAGVDEYELFLLVEDGPARLLRLSPERQGDAGPVRWRMPRVGASRARLVLRAGGRFGETESEPSEAFEVEAGEPLSRAELLRGEEELARHFGDGDAPPPRLVTHGAPTIGAARAEAVAVESPRDSGARPPIRALRDAGPPAPAREVAPPAQTLLRRPSFTPLRN